MPDIELDPGYVVRICNHETYDEFHCGRVSILI